MTEPDSLAHPARRCRAALGNDGLSTIPQQRLCGSDGETEVRGWGVSGPGSGCELRVSVGFPDSQCFGKMHVGNFGFPSHVAAAVLNLSNV